MARHREGEPERITGSSLDGQADPKQQARIWGEWPGREVEYFHRCAEAVDPLSWERALAICGPGARAYARLTRRAFGRLTSNDPPAALVVGPTKIAEMRAGVARITTYSRYDPVDAPAIVMELLPYFDGRPVAEAVAAMAEERGIRVEKNLIRKMVDFELLVEPGSARS